MFWTPTWALATGSKFTELRPLLSWAPLQAFHFRSGRIFFPSPTGSFSFYHCLLFSCMFYNQQNVWEPLSLFIIFTSLKLSANFLASQLKSVCILGVSFGLGLRYIPAFASTRSWKQCGHASLKLCEEPWSRRSSRPDRDKYLVIPATLPVCTFLKPGESPILGLTVKKCQTNPNWHKMNGLYSSKMLRSRNKKKERGGGVPQGKRLKRLNA